jgi:hypothetical protein
MIVFSDLHLREQTADVCFRVLDRVWELSGRGKKRIIFLGDFWHLRYAVNVSLLNRVNELFTAWASESLVHSDLPAIELLPGNHDQVSPDGRNALEVLAQPGVRVWTELGVDEQGCGFVPYRKDLGQQISDLVSVAGRAPLVFGHFGVRGARMTASKLDTDGIQVSLPPSVRLILGHYHGRQQGVGWEYVGSPYQISFGEAGNRCGVLMTESSSTSRSVVSATDKAVELAFCELREGPRHHILKWDPATEEEPPPMPQDYQDGDKVRLDVVASREVIVAGKLQGKLKRAGLEDVSVQVIPVASEREHRFEQQDGEPLLDAAQRFAEERFREEGVEGSDTGRAMEALRRWAQ